MPNMIFDITICIMYCNVAMQYYYYVNMGVVITKYVW